MPSPPKKRTKKNDQRYINECMVWVKNQSKWKAARKYAEDRGKSFIILTEDDILPTNK